MICNRREKLLHCWKFFAQQTAWKKVKEGEEGEGETRKILNHNAMKMYDNSTIEQMAIVLLKQITTHIHTQSNNNNNECKQLADF